MTENKRDEMTVEQWISLRKGEGKRIDPDHAEFTFHWGQIMDPYGVDPDLPDEYDQIGRLYFARNPNSDLGFL
ncbi:MAG: hypothetical protein JAZ19_03690 [Candidatus Thiodiazotropha taylori]|nr:hypothetical protein [Candidatus Thiodiazotropha taylori]